MRLAHSIPSIPGIFQSIMTSSKGFFLAAFSISAMASSPEAESTTLNEKEFNKSLKISLDVALSSTTRAFRPLKSTRGAKRFLAFYFPCPKLAVNIKLVPRPYSLSTRISPPIMFTSLLLIASPKPVPPNLRVVEVSAWLND
jgi:hypothetical protein